MSAHIPKGFAAITPYLLLHDAVGFIKFAQQALGATQRMANFDDDGRLTHAELELAGCVLEIGQPKGDFEPTRTALHVFVEDPDTIWKNAVEHGATPLYEVTDHPYGERSGGVADAWGNQWYFACVTDADARDKEA